MDKKTTPEIMQVCVEAWTQNIIEGIKAVKYIKSSSKSLTHQSSHPVMAYDRPSDESNQSLPHDYFLLRNQGDLHHAWLWRTYMKQNPSVFHAEAPSQYLLDHMTEQLYIQHKNTMPFLEFCRWMGRIAV